MQMPTSWACWRTQCPQLTLGKCRSSPNHWHASTRRPDFAISLDPWCCYVMLCYVMLCYSLDVDHLKKLQLPVGPSGGQEEHGSSPGVLLAAMGFDMGSHIGPLNTLHLSYHGTCEIQSPCSDSVPRLSAQLLHTTWQQTELNCEADLKKLKEWSQKFDLFASKQVRGCHQNIFWSIKIMPFNGLSNTYVHECAFIFIYGAYMYICIFIEMHICIYEYFYIHMHICVYNATVDVYISIYISVTCIHTYLYIYIQINPFHTVHGWVPVLLAASGVHGLQVPERQVPERHRSDWEADGSKTSAGQV